MKQLFAIVLIAMTITSIVAHADDDVNDSPASPSTEKKQEKNKPNISIEVNAVEIIKMAQEQRRRQEAKYIEEANRPKPSDHLFPACQNGTGGINCPDKKNRRSIHVD